MTNGAFTDTFAAWGVHIYKMAAAGTLVAPSLYLPATLSGGALTFNFSGPAGQTYRVLSATNLALPASQWTMLASGAFTVYLTNFTDAAPANATRFYRLASP